MCLVLIAYRRHPRYPLLLAANRDEFHARPAQALHWWNGSPRMLAGRDLQAGGTWLGLDASGRMALVTNYRDPSSPRPDASSRGSLVGDFLGGPIMGVVWFLAKAIFFVIVQIWIRWTLPRLRVDQLMNICWKVMIPFGMATVLAIGTIVTWLAH